MTTGAIPKPDPSRARDVRRRAFDGHTFDSSSGVKAPRMPACLKSAPARRWWRTWASSPQAQLFTGTDWARLEMLAPLVELYFTDPTPARMSEIRLNESRFGATPEDRLRLRWRFQGERVPADDPVGDYGAASSSPKRRRPKRRSDPRLRIVE